MFHHCQKSKTVGRECKFWQDFLFIDALDVSIYYINSIYYQDLDTKVLHISLIYRKNIEIGVHMVNVSNVVKHLQSKIYVYICHLNGIPANIMYKIAT